ncbi:ArpU family phage packaging/lysis transcriptional regulator [Lactobacillus bombicola]|uniref:Phage transcriptional regulator, ArpU family n=1 Tax=Lactobacillus bombicola TaxID=1505723 RepID=A0ABX9LWQ6_9LACO|nr:ArpU family phage packaging/lysis transcriptional regulator [Lactobacillus bombicola]RHW48982.1 hypothetical protein DS833_05600 [Lactobacillus bombicola]RHW53574.1 hypothetical protein DS834_01165 [Lactobacillus bombicola]
MIGAIELSLFKNAKLNNSKTAEKVKDFFANDFKHYLRLANKHRTDISSPKMDITGIAAHDGLNHQDELMTVNLDALACVAAVDHTISSCDNPNNQILYLCYIKQLQDVVIAERLGYQKSRYQEIKSDALVEFAERFDSWREIDGASVDSLLVFDNVELVDGISGSGNLAEDDRKKTGSQAE